MTQLRLLLILSLIVGALLVACGTAVEAASRGEVEQLRQQVLSLKVEVESLREENAQLKLALADQRAMVENLVAQLKETEESSADMGHMEKKLAASEDGHEAGHAGGARTHVTLQEWAIGGEAGQALGTITGGPVTLEIHNDGKGVHLLDVWKGGEIVGDQVEGGVLLARSDYLVGGDMGMLKVELEPGEYLLTCSVPGHILRGMHTPFQVSEMPMD